MREREREREREKEDVGMIESQREEMSGGVAVAVG